MNGRVLSLPAILSFLAMLPTAALAKGHHAPVMVHARAAQGQPTPGPVAPGAPQPGPVTGPATMSTNRRSAPAALPAA
jgi:hypothetical protein